MAPATAEAQKLNAVGPRLCNVQLMRVGLIGAGNMARALARGWSLTRTSDGRLVRSTADVAPGASLVTVVADGTVRSTVEETSP